VISRGRDRKRHIYKRDSLSPDLIDCVSRVLEVAARDVQSNIFLFLDVDSEVDPPTEEYGKIYGLTRRGSFNDQRFAPVDDAVMVALAREGPFPVVTWISPIPLSPTIPEVFRTALIAHELGHARQIDQFEDLCEAWDYYKDFLTDVQQPLLQWHQPLEIDTELHARQVVRNLHPGESLEPLLYYYRNYERVLQFEASGGFDVLDYFTETVRRGPSGFRDWIKAGDRMWRENSVLLQLAPELGLRSEDFA